MKAIVLIFVRTRDVKLPAGQSLAISISASLQGVGVVGADKSTIHNESAPPFWTWFIENPRTSIQDLSAAETIVDVAATLGASRVILGAPQRNALINLLRGNVIREVSNSLPEEIDLLVYA